MANYPLTQTGEQVQNILNAAENAIENGGIGYIEGNRTNNTWVIPREYIKYMGNEGDDEAYNGKCMVMLQTNMNALAEMIEEELELPEVAEIARSLQPMVDAILSQVNEEHADTYIDVICDDVAHKSKVFYEEGSGIVGNWSLLGFGEDTGENYALYCTPGENFNIQLVVKNSEALITSHSFGFSSETIHKIDSKFISENPIVQNAIENGGIGYTKEGTKTIELRASDFMTEEGYDLAADVGMVMPEGSGAFVKLSDIFDILTPDKLGESMVLFIDGTQYTAHFMPFDANDSKNSSSIMLSDNAEWGAFNFAFIQLFEDDTATMKQVIFRSSGEVSTNHTVVMTTSTTTTIDSKFLPGTTMWTEFDTETNTLWISTTPPNKA